MKTSFILINTFFIFFGLSALNVNSQAGDSCSLNLINLNGSVPFDTTSLNCYPVWDAEGFILRYSKTGSNVWSFILSVPADTNSYIAMGFSMNGMMVGSSAMVGWIDEASGAGIIKQYYLGGTSPNLVVPDQGSLQVLTNSSVMVSQSSRLYMAFQLMINTDQPLSRVIYSVGPTGMLPSAPNNLLSQHRNQLSTTFNYVTGQSIMQSPYTRLRKSHGVLNMLGWGILIPIGAIVARYFKQWDPIWFYSHTCIQSFGFILGVAGVICGFVLDDRLYVNIATHKALGIFILVLGCLQIMAFLARPNKASKLRKYWNWYHYSVGRIMIIFAAANIFYGIHLGKEGNGWNAGYGVVLAVLFIVAFVLELRLWMRN